MPFQYSSLLPGERFDVRNYIQQNCDKLSQNCETIVHHEYGQSSQDPPAATATEVVAAAASSSSPPENEEKVRMEEYHLGKNYVKPKTMQDLERDIEMIDKQPNPQAFALNTNRKRSKFSEMNENQNVPEHLMKLLLSKSYSEYSNCRPSRIAGEDCQGTQDKSLALLSIRFFKPISKNLFGKKIRTRQLTLDKEFVVLSCQRLSVLRDAYCCIGDLILYDDYSERIHEPIEPFRGHHEFGTFLIDDVFYTDERHRYSGSSIKTVDPIIEWAAKRNLATFQQKDMNNVCFEDLTIQLGFPYLYLHSPHCEHILVFNRIEFSPPNSRPSPAPFPLIVDWKENTVVDCDFCAIRPAKWLIYDSPRLPYTPFHVCKKCNLEFNYDTNGKKIGHFIAMPIIYDCDYVDLEYSISQQDQK